MSAQVLEFPGVAPKKERLPISQYERYALPFFDRERLLTWAIEPTDYSKDCETGRALAITFLRSNDGTNGWMTLLGQIVTDMINAGPCAERWPSGRPHSNGLVIGFMGGGLRGAASHLTVIARTRNGGGFRAALLFCHSAVIALQRALAHAVEHVCPR
jgi:hypothetical protein